MRGNLVLVVYYGVWMFVIGRKVLCDSDWGVVAAICIYLV